MQLGAFGDYAGVFIEITKSEHKAGGPGWELGACLWSPSRNRSGADRYALMREPSEGDLVLHFYEDDWPNGLTETRLCGSSRVAKPVEEMSEEPPAAGRWAGMAAYYRIQLRDYAAFAQPVALSVIVRDYADELLRDLRDNEPAYYPFNTHGTGIRTVQGIYLARCTAGLYSLLRRALAINDSDGREPAGERRGHEEFAEARRLARERFFFARNPSLARTAKERFGTSCQVCGFNFGSVYGDLGDGYAEVHHLSPLSERPEDEWNEQVTTSLNQVAVLCSNCHRVIHRRRPALTIEDLRRALGRKDPTDPA